MKMTEALKMPGAKALLLSFFCYSAVETTAGLWASNYLTLHWGLDEVTAASWASFFYFGMTAGRAASGFITMRLDDTGMIRLGQSVLLIGIALLFLPVSEYTAMAGLVMVGLGCAPIDPSIIHSTPVHLRARRARRPTISRL